MDIIKTQRERETERERERERKRKRREKDSDEDCSGEQDCDCAIVRVLNTYRSLNCAHLKIYSHKMAASPTADINRSCTHIISLI